MDNGTVINGTSCRRPGNKSDAAAVPVPRRPWTVIGGIALMWPEVHDNLPSGKKPSLRIKTPADHRMTGDGQEAKKQSETEDTITALARTAHCSIPLAAMCVLAHLVCMDGAEFLDFSSREQLLIGHIEVTDYFCKDPCGKKNLSTTNGCAAKLKKIKIAITGSCRSLALSRMKSFKEGAYDDKLPRHVKQAGNGIWRGGLLPRTHLQRRPWNTAATCSRKQLESWRYSETSRSTPTTTLAARPDTMDDGALRIPELQRQTLPPASRAFTPFHATFLLEVLLPMMTAEPTDSLIPSLSGINRPSITIHLPGHSTRRSRNEGLASYAASDLELSGLVDPTTLART
ncbi:uncharacterized protein CLUP02_11725 [Colletotrichum lupini]|uniref:Uncharacterized protein n=1 Tax=Colletotrichum lupini TaxID=145971 RepID=A0A9Q8WKQ7_9PEZI|nr:uncharacterized protein CLUP02_11725 [Colletotrichum lupini]UQC86225.1 hypothetical protein CLUP02_11725 [Colletotrichum lupini]